MADTIRDISLSSKKAFRLDGDDSRIIYLDTSDMNIIVRLEETYPEIRKLAVEATEKLASVSKADEENDTDLTEIANVLKDIDARMRDKVDYVFASKISDKCAPDNNMFDPVDGEFRFEYIIGTLVNLYANNLSVEFDKMKERVKKHTAKYTKKK